MDRILDNARFCELAYRAKEDVGDPDLFCKEHDIINFDVIKAGSSAQCWVFQKVDTLIFAFAGTDSLHDMYIDTQMRLTHIFPSLPEMGRVHFGFNRYAMELKEAIYMAIEDFLVLTPGEKLGLTSTGSLERSIAQSSSGRTSPNANSLRNAERITPRALGGPMGPRVARARNERSSMEHITDIRLTSCMIQVHRVNPNAPQTINKIVFTGHSLGGCCAIAALHVAMDFRKLARIKCYTYGSPMIGDRAFAKTLCEYVPYNFNIVHKYDLIPSTPCSCIYSKQHGMMVIDNDATVLVTKRWFYMLMMFMFGWSCCCNQSLRYTGAALKGEAHKIKTYIQVLEKIYTGTQASKEEYIARIYPIFATGTSGGLSD